MEDIKQYIESGILELYVLNDLTLEEKLEVERYAATYPAIKQELNDISYAMELFADHHAIEPRESLRDTVIDKLLSNSALKTPFTAPNNHLAEQPKVVQMKQRVSETNFYKHAFAASIALLLVSLAALFTTYNNLKDSREELVNLQVQNQKFANQVNFQENQLNRYKQSGSLVQNPVALDTVSAKTNSTSLLALENALKLSKSKIAALEHDNKDRDRAENIFYDPDSRFIKLKGTNGNKSTSALLIAWNPDKKKLYINKKQSGLVPNDKNHQYQLWAIRKLKPISLGVFDIGKKDSMIQSMLSIDRAAAFAVTLEPRGGSEKPTLKQMVAMSISHK